MGFLNKILGKAGEKRLEGICAPIAGQTVSVSEIPDPTFSRGILGKGVAIIPTDTRVCAPCNATVDVMFTTGHAVSLIADNGAEILIHVGLETVALGGKCFQTYVRNGQRVEKGQLMMEIDLEGIRAAGLNPITPVLICNSGDFGAITTVTGHVVTTDDVIIKLAK